MVGDYFLFGSITRKYSFRGEVIIKTISEYAFLMKDVDVFFMKNNDGFSPLKVENTIRQKPLLFRTKFQGIDSEDLAKGLLNRDVYLPHSILPPLPPKGFYSHEILGFLVMDVENGFLGTLEYVNQSTPQQLFEVRKGQQLILIPAVENFIEKISRKDKTIYIKTPKGLVDLYL